MSDPVPSSAIYDATTAGRALLTAADAAAQRTLLELLTSTQIAAAYQPIGSYATAAQGALADSAVQPGDLATVATTGSYNDLTDKPSGSGDVVGPASATDNAVARFDATTGKLIQNSLCTISDAGYLLLPSGAIATPAIQIGATGTGFWAGSGLIWVSLSGSDNWVLTNTYVDGASGLGARIMRSSGSRTVPTIRPRRDASTGLAADTAELSIIVNSTEVVRCTAINNALLTAQSSTAVPLCVQASASQTGNLSEWKNSAGTVIAAVRNNGALRPVALPDTDAANDSIYYSTDAAKLVYKDSSGTVNNLY